MDMSFTKAQIAFREKVREFVRASMPPHIKAKADVDANFEHREVMEWHKVLFKRGWAAPNVSGLVTVAALGAYVVGGPIVHGSNGAGTGVVAGSLALRLGLPIVGALFGGRIGEWADSSSSRTGNGFDLTPFFDAVYGFIIGMGTASVIDIVALSWKDEKGQRAAAPSRVQALRLTPIVGMNREDAHRYAPAFGVAGSF